MNKVSNKILKVISIAKWKALKALQVKVSLKTNRKSS